MRLDFNFLSLNNVWHNQVKTSLPTRGLRLRKSLILFRHAKSDWEADYGSDHERPVAKRGIKAAKQMGRLLADSGKLPDSIICSTALRARQTLELATRAGNWDSNIQYSDDLYEASARTMIMLMQQISQPVNTVMLVGHEPTWSHLVGLLIGGGNIRFPTAAMARIDFYFNDWRSLGPATGQLRWLLQPRFFTSKDET